MTVVSGSRLHSLWGPRHRTCARIEGDGWVTDPSGAGQRVDEDGVWTLPVSRTQRATPWTAQERAAHKRPHALARELDSGPEHRRQ